MAKRREALVDPLEPFDVGNVDADGDGSVTLSLTASGAPLLAPSSLRDLSPRVMEQASELQDLAAQIAQLRGRLDGLVAALRDAGVAWSGIGFCVGLTPEGARLRWGVE